MQRLWQSYVTGQNRSLRGFVRLRSIALSCVRNSPPDLYLRDHLRSQNNKSSNRCSSSKVSSLQAYSVTSYSGKRKPFNYDVVAAQSWRVCNVETLVPAGVAWGASACPRSTMSISHIQHDLKLVSISKPHSPQIHVVVMPNAHTKGSVSSSAKRLTLSCWSCARASRSCSP